MIPQKNLNDVNAIYEEANSKITDLENNIGVIKDDIQKKLKVISCEFDYINNFYTKLNSGMFTRGNDIKTFDKASGDFNSYGICAVPKFVKDPINIFNLQTSSGSYIFRQDIAASLVCNNVTYENALDIFKHDKVSDKNISFYELDSDTVTLTVGLDNVNSLGSNKSNLIEIDPFLPGSFDIESVTIGYENEDGALNFMPAVFNDVKSIGKQYVVLDKKYSINTVEFKIKLNYSINKNSVNVYPFGLKHIYFYNSDFKSDSYAIFRVDRESNISYIKDKLYIMTTGGNFTSTVSSENVELYSSYDNSTLTDRIYPSTDDNILTISKSINTFYAKIPMPSDKALIGVSFFPELKGQEEIFNNLKTVYIDRIIDTNNVVISEKEEVMDAVNNIINTYPSSSSTTTTTQTPTVDNTDTNYIYRDQVLQYITLDTISQSISSPITINSPNGLVFDSTTVNNSNIILTDVNKNKINVYVSLNNDGNLITISHSNLEYDKSYILTINGLKYGTTTKYDFPASTISFYTECSVTTVSDKRYAIPCSGYTFNIKFDFNINFNSVTSEKVFIIDDVTGRKINIEFKINSLNSNILDIAIKEILSGVHSYTLYIKNGISSSNGLNVKLDTTIIKFVTADAALTELEPKYNVSYDKIVLPIDSPVIESEVIVLKEDRTIYNDATGQFTISNNIVSFNSDILKPNTVYYLAINNGTSSYLLMIQIKDTTSFNSSSKIYKGFVPLNYEYIYTFDSIVDVNVVKPYIIAYNSDNNLEEIEVTAVDNYRIKIKIDNMIGGKTYSIIINNNVYLSEDVYIELKTQYSNQTIDKQYGAMPNKYKVQFDFSSTVNSACITSDYFYIVNGDTYDIIPSTINIIGNSIQVVPTAVLAPYNNYIAVASDGVYDISGHKLVYAPIIQSFSPVSYANVQEYKNIPVGYKVPLSFNFNVTTDDINKYLYVCDGYYNRLDYSIETINSKSYSIVVTTGNNNEFYLGLSKYMHDVDNTVNINNDIIKHYTIGSSGVSLKTIKWFDPSDSFSFISNNTIDINSITIIDNNNEVIPSTSKLVNNIITVTPTVPLNYSSQYSILLSSNNSIMHYDLTTKDKDVTQIDYGSISSTQPVNITFEKNVSTKSLTDNNCFYVVDNNNIVVTSYTMQYLSPTNKNIVSATQTSTISTGSYKLIASKAIQYEDKTNPSCTRIINFNVI